MATFKIHPAIGIARLGNAKHEFYLSPEQPGQLPIDANPDGTAKRKQNGKEKPVRHFKVADNPGLLKRQGARFRVFSYSDDDQDGSEIKRGQILDFDNGQGIVVDIEWTVHLANKKASWYEFRQKEGMHGYASTHPLRNATITNREERRQLIIDPGPQTVSFQEEEKRNRHFKKGYNPGYLQNFPPENIQPNPIETLGELKATCQDDCFRLVVLGGFGNSGSVKRPVIKQYANNDGWFDDVSDGPVTARITYAYLKGTLWNIAKYKDQILAENGTVNQAITVDGKKIPIVTKQKTVHHPAWVVVGFPGYVPEILDMITMNELIYDVSVRYFAAAPQMYGVEPYDVASNSPKDAAELEIWRNSAKWNPDYYAKFYGEIWPVLKRPDMFKHLYGYPPFAGSAPHNKGTGGNLDELLMSQPPQQGDDPNYDQRQRIYMVLRKPGQENLFLLNNPQDPSTPANQRVAIAMPGLLGNNPLSNLSPEKFMRLTDTQLFQLKQWANGKFINECNEWQEGDERCTDPFSQPATSGLELDQRVLSNVLGGAFCPGGELPWIMWNPAIYSEPYRIRHADYVPSRLSIPSETNLAKGLQPGDLTKYMALPWQADFAVCTEQPVDITYESWVTINPDSTGDPLLPKQSYNIPWWPAHRPMIVSDQDQNKVFWASENMLHMVTAWSDLGFVHKVEDGSQEAYVLTEYNESNLGPLKPAGTAPSKSVKQA